MSLPVADVTTKLPTSNHTWSAEQRCSQKGADFFKNKGAFVFRYRCCTGLTYLSGNRGCWSHESNPLQCILPAPQSIASGFCLNRDSTRDIKLVLQYCHIISFNRNQRVQHSLQLGIWRIISMNSVHNIASLSS